MKIKFILNGEIFNCHKVLTSIQNLHDELHELGIPLEAISNLLIYYIDHESDKVLISNNEDVIHAVSMGQSGNQVRFFIQESDSSLVLSDQVLVVSQQTHEVQNPDDSTRPRNITFGENTKLKQEKNIIFHNQQSFDMTSSQRQYVQNAQEIMNPMNDQIGFGVPCYNNKILEISNENDDDEIFLALESFLAMNTMEKLIDQQIQKFYDV